MAVDGHPCGVWHASVWPGAPRGCGTPRAAASPAHIADDGVIAGRDRGVAHEQLAVRPAGLAPDEAELGRSMPYLARSSAALTVRASASAGPVPLSPTVASSLRTTAG